MADGNGFEEESAMPQQTYDRGAGSEKGFRKSTG